MVDYYTKFILTVIAICLGWLAFGPILVPATATAQLGSAPYDGMVPVVIRAIDKGPGRWDAIDVKPAR